MRFALALLIAACVLGTVGCASTGPSPAAPKGRVSGAADSVLFLPSEEDIEFLQRVDTGAPAPRRRKAAAASSPSTRLSVVPVRSRQAIASASFDPAVGGYLFRMPARIPNAGLEPICLTLRTARGTPIPLRQERGDDDGYEFRNPAWEELVQKAGRIEAVKAELAPIDDQYLLAKAERDAIGKKYGEPVASGSQPCPTPAAGPPPPRPASALEDGPAREAAPGMCALKWEASLGPSAAAMFEDAGKPEVWARRAEARVAFDAMPTLALDVSGGDLELIRSAAVGGPLVLQHQKGVQAFEAGQSACERRVPQMAAQALSGWNEQVKNLASAPQIARQRCEADVAKVAGLEERMRDAQAKRAPLAARLADLEEVGGTPAAPVKLDSTRCN